MERIRNGRSNVQVPKENYNFKKISTTKFKLNLGVEVKSLSVFLIFKNCFLRRTCWLWRLGLFNSLLQWKKEWLVLLIKIEPPIRLKLIKKFSWTEATESLIQHIVAKSCKFDTA